MMTVFFVVMTLCSGSEGCVDERKPVAYATQAECLNTVSSMALRKGVKYRCHQGPQQLVSEVIRSTATQPHLVTTNAPTSP